MADGGHLPSVEGRGRWGYGDVEYPGMDDLPPEVPSDDPDAPCLATLGAAEQDAYHPTLSGHQPTADEIAAGETRVSPGRRDQGCMGRASHDVLGDDPTQSDENKPVVDSLQQFGVTPWDAPEWAELDALVADLDARAADHAG